MDDLTAARRYLRARARWLCGGVAGRGKLDPVYVTTTEGRDLKQFWDHYSSCGDLVQALAFHMGVRTPYVNRTEHTGWIPGRNLLHFYDTAQVGGSFPFLHDYVKAHGAPARAPASDYEPSAGDFGFIWSPGQNNAHTFVFGDRIDAGHVETFNYGAGGMTRTEFPGAHCAASSVERRNGGLWLGQRKLQFVLEVPRLLADANPALLPQVSGDVIDDLEERVP